MDEKKEDRVTVFESTMRELLKTDVGALSPAQLRAYVGSLKTAWEKFLAKPPHQ